MADLFIKQAKEYQENRPSYPPELIRFIASKTPNHDLAWDVGTGNGQAAVILAGIYKNVVGTDTSEQQLALASKLPNIRYQHTRLNMSLSELERDVVAQDTVDLVTVAQAVHWASGPYWAPARKLVDDKYRNIDFPFEPVDGTDNTGPFEFVTEKSMDLDGYLTYIRSWSSYQTAKAKGVELLSEEVIADFERAWQTENGSRKVVRYPVYLRIGKVGN
ncbi:hypothetical protein IFM89_026938 [Coptis chinensis]|uniref:Methyltransferase type 11 domain-containing protein n=1 Tax=Coptis chinensis TaxID=261450 RepID=A0A835I6U0_9MAGN|nr:hypothetical protein IFM89_026938 [Coptis chinensis]